MVEAEYAVIGTILVDNKFMPDADSVIKPEYFENPMLKEIYRLMLTAYGNKENIGVPVIIENLKSDFKYEDIDNTIRECLVKDDILSFKENLKVIRQSYQYRRLSMVIMSQNPKYNTVTEDIANLIGELESIGGCEQGNKVLSLSEITKEYKGEYFRKREQPQLHFPFAALDDKVNGLEGGDLIVIGARPAVGKSALVAQLALNFTKNNDKRVGFYSLEMKRKQLYERFSALSSGLTMDKIRTAEQFENIEEKQLFDDGNSFLEKKTTLFISEGAKTVSQIRRESQHMEYDLIIIDYLQLLIPESNYRGNRYAEVGEISHSLKALAMDFDIPVIALSQLNRVSTAAKDSKPSMAEMRESGDIEQDASIIILLWNKNDEGTLKGCKVEKNRQGKFGELELKYNGAYMMFSDTNGYTPTGKDDFAPIENIGNVGNVGNVGDVGDVGDDDLMPWD